MGRERSMGRFKTFFRFVRSIFPKLDDRPNEWSPVPTGIVISSFMGPIGIIFLIGVAFDEDPGMSPFYGLMALICALIVIWAMSDASYIAGMRRIADQDLSEKARKARIESETRHKAREMRNIDPNAKNGK